MDGGIVKGGLTPKMILDDIFFNFPTPFPIYSSSLPLPADDSFVDQLLNFNNFDPIQPPQFQQQQQFNNNSQQHVAEDKDKDKDSSFLSLPIHTTEEAELEWLSHFVDDSFSPYSTPFPPGYVPKPEPEREPERKRTRAGRWVRPTSKSDSSPPPKKKVLKQSGKGKGNRTCRHCGTKKTPQWRGGPNGLKTLCNACGVRFKGGRLLPEYRPASSPSYKSEVHSNSHRKVMEMRMVKGGLTPNMILDDVFFNFPTPFPIHSCPPSADDSFLDQLLNLNNFDVPIQPPQFQQQQQQLFNNNSTVVVNSQQHVAQDKDKDKDSSFLSLPIHNTEEAELERLSHFVDDSFSPYSTPFPPEPEPDKHEREPERKRTRTGRWVRPTSKSPPPKKQVRKESDKEDEQRRCSHCGTEKTPLWRSGPNGPKTLCNACGVRFKGGRLLPEYRPASSPSYSSELHSNLHRKVIEMRMVKEEEAGP